MNSELFADPAVRSALSYAVDRDTIAEKYYRGFARSAVLPMSPQSPYYSQKLADFYNTWEDTMKNWDFLRLGK